MYEEHFGLERPPFKITPDPSLFYEGGKRGDILSALVYTIHRGEGIIKVVGEVGSGKTMLCRMLQLKLPDSIEIVYIANPSVSPQDILFVIAHELSLQVTKDASKHEVVHQLHDYLLRRHSENKQVVLFIEEAQGMPLDTLEEIRLLSNLETDQNKLLQIVLFGQPELDQNLAQQSIRQLRERITHNFNLDPLDQQEIHSYLNFRMREVGYTGPELINKSVAIKVELYSHGLLRRINIIADKILLSAFAEGTHNLDPKHVTAAVNDSEFERKAETRLHRLWWFAIPLLIALSFGLYQTRATWMTIVGFGLSAQVEDMTDSNRAGTQATPHIEFGETQQTVAEHALSAPPSVAGDSAQSSAVNAAVAQQRTVEANDLAPQLIGATPSTELEALDQTAALALEPIMPPLFEAETTLDHSAVRLAISSIDARGRGDKANGVAQPIAAVSDILHLTANAKLPSSTEPTGRIAVDNNQWLENKLQASRDWLSQADRDKISIQVLMRSKTAVGELVNYLRNQWPLDISKTYLYEVHTEEHSVYHVYYSEYDTVTDGRNQLDLLPDSIKVNLPYLNSVYRMQKALL